MDRPIQTTDAETPTPEELLEQRRKQRANWWYYHKRHVLIGVILVISILDIIRRALGIGIPSVDYSICYVGSVPLSESDAAALQQGLEAISPDMNGDGKVRVSLVQYIAFDTGDSDTLYYAQAQQTHLVADVTQCVSFFFLLEDPDFFQDATGCLCYPDGTLPAPGDNRADGKYILWKDCPGLTDITTEKDLSEYGFARRGFWTDTTCENAEACEELWRSLITNGLC